MRKKQFITLLGFLVVGSLDREAWFCRITSLTVEMISDEAEAFSEFRGADSTKHQKCSCKALENFPTPSTVEYHMPKKNRKVVKDHGVNSANGYPK